MLLNQEIRDSVYNQLQSLSLSLSLSLSPSLSLSLSLSLPLMVLIKSVVNVINTHCVDNINV